MAEHRRTATPARRYRVVCYDLEGNHQQVVMDATGAGFVAAVGTIDDGVLRGELSSAGPHELQAHLALAIANDEQLTR